MPDLGPNDNDSAGKVEPRQTWPELTRHFRLWWAPPRRQVFAPSFKKLVSISGSKSGSDSAAVNAKTEIVNAPDGTLQSRKSLLKQAGKQVAGDASASIDNAKDIVKDVLRKK